MKKVLMIACSFPPLGGPGVQRSVKFVKFLRNYGYEPVIFTRECKNETVIDKTLLKDIPEGIKIIRTKDYMYDNLPGIMRIPGKVMTKFMCPDYAAIWWKKVKDEAEKILIAEKINLVYTTSSPYSDHLLGLYLKHKHPEIKWVADFRDEWTTNPYFLEDSLYKYKIKREKKMEAEVLNNADWLITNTPVMLDHFIEGREELREKFSVIPNGYDVDDFQDMNIGETNTNDKMTLTYTGALYGRRKPDTFFAALGELTKEGLIDRDKVSVRLVGNYKEDEINGKINANGLDGIVKIVGLLPHDECIREQLTCDALVLIEGSGKGAEAFYTGKLFEYMNTGRPILAMLPENGVAADLVRESRVGIVASVDSVSEIKECILKYYREWLSGKIEYCPDYKVIERFDRRKQTEELAKIFSHITE